MHLIIVSVTHGVIGRPNSCSKYSKDVSPVSFGKVSCNLWTTRYDIPYPYNTFTTRICVFQNVYWLLKIYYKIGHYIQGQFDGNFELVA